MSDLRWRQFYDAVSLDIESNPQLFALLVLRLERNQRLQVLLASLEDLSGTTLEKQISAYQRAVKTAGVDFSRLFNAAVKVLRDCLQDIKLTLCETARKPLSTSDRIVRKIVAHSTFRDVELHNVTQEFVINRIGDFIEADYITPQLIEALYKILDPSRPILSPKQLARVSRVSQRDEALKHAIVVSWHRNAEALIGKSPSLALSFLQEAARIDSSVIPRSDKLRTIAVQSGEAEFLSWNLSGSSTGAVLSVFGLTILALATLLCRFYLRSDMEETAVLNRLSQDEARLVARACSTLGLPPWAGVKDLRRRYRRRIKELHPDTGTGSIEELVKLREDYGNAIELLRKF
ncbi:MAG: hypothetical protein KDD66_00750 [Bdellovibrionales bacterium]|nr:hypothetical protein [Bdellovibrionales bacterium]